MRAYFIAFNLIMKSSAKVVDLSCRRRSVCRHDYLLAFWNDRVLIMFYLSGTVVYYREEIVDLILVEMYGSQYGFSCVNWTLLFSFS